MTGLLDFIFSELNIEELNKKKGKEYLLYLNEILLEIKSESEFQKFQAIKARLNTRLTNIDSQERQ
jgi:hypothetical protein